MFTSHKAILFRTLVVLSLAFGALGQSLTFQGKWTTDGDSAVAVEVAGTNAFIATGKGKLQIIDISNSQTPTLHGEVVLSDPTRPGVTMSDVKISGNFAYVIGLRFWTNFRESRLFVVNIGDPANPTVAGSIALPVDLVGTRFELSVVGSMAYVACGQAGLQIVDCSNAAAPKIVGGFKLSDLVWDVEVVDGLAYLAAAGNGFVIVDVTDPANPWRVGGSTQSFYAYNVDVRGNYAYVSGEGPMFLRIFDVSNPVQPQQLSGTVIVDAFTMRGVTATATHAFISEGPAGADIYNIANPATPIKAGKIGTGVFLDDVAVSGTTVYTAEREGGMRIYDVTNAAQPTLIGAYDISFNVGGPHVITVSSGYAYVRDLSSGIRIFDVRDTTKPTEVGIYRQLGVGVPAVDGNVAYISTTTGFDVVDVSNPPAPAKIGAYQSTNNGIADIVVAGNYVYTSFGEVVNVTNPSNPQFVTTIPANALSGVELLEREGNFLYALLGYYNVFHYHFLSGVRIIDISNPASPVTRGLYNPPAAVSATEQSFDMTVADGIIYVARNQDLLIGDARNPDAPTHVTIRTADAPLGTVAASGPALFQGRNVYVDLLNVREPSAPTLVGSKTVDPNYDVLPEANYGLVDAFASGGFMYGIGQARTNAPVSLVIYAGDVGPVPNLPRLSASVQDAKVIIRWSTNFTGLKLYSTPNLGGAWQLVISNVPIQGDSYSFTNTRPVGTTLFYKLSSN